MTRSFGVAMVLVLGLAGACGGHPKLATLGEDPVAPPSGSSNITIKVVSHNFRDANVYLNLGASRQRLGLAGGNSTSVFTVHWNAQLATASEATLTAEQIGDENTVRSSSVTVAAGANIVWTLSSQFYEVNLEVY